MNSFCSFRKTFLAAEKTHAAHDDEIEKYEKDLKDVERLRKDYEEKLQDESQHSGRNLALEENQVRLCLSLAKGFALGY